MIFDFMLSGIKKKITILTAMSVASINQIYLVIQIYNVTGELDAVASIATVAVASLTVALYNKL